LPDEPEEFVPGDRLLLVSIRQSIRFRSVYDATRYAWPVNRERAENRVVLGCNEGIVEGVYMPTRWLDASPGQASQTNFPGFAWAHTGQRWGFKGSEADEAVKQRYLGKRVPKALKIGRKGFRYFDG
jgi:hypothetical protein